MSLFDRLFRIGQPGSVYVADGGALGLPHVATLPACDATREGEMRQVKGASGTANRAVVCAKNAADAYDWRDTLIIPLLADPNADRILFWDDSAGTWAFLTPDATDLAISGTTLALGSAPSFSDFTNATHDHGDADDGGTLLPAAMPSMGLVLIDDDDFSGEGSEIFDGVFTATYDNYLIVGRLSLANSNSGIHIRLRAASATVSLANYYYGNFVVTAAGGTAAEGAAATTVFPLAPAPGVGLTWTDVAFALLVSSPQLADETVVCGDSSSRFNTPGLGRRMLGGFYNATTQFDGFVLVPDAGNISGRVMVYGVRQ